jgi:hypothetical protein
VSWAAWQNWWMNCNQANHRLAWTVLSLLIQRLLGAAPVTGTRPTRSTLLSLDRELP